MPVARNQLIGTNPEARMYKLRYRAEETEVGKQGHRRKHLGLGGSRADDPVRSGLEFADIASIL